MTAPRPLLLLLPAALALTACATDTRYPSLAKRDFERVEGNAPAAEPDVQTPVSAQPLPQGLEERLAELRQQALAAHAEFENLAGAARSRAQAAAGAPQGSTRWSDAIVAISDVESARSETMLALAELDSMLALGAVAEARTDNNRGLTLIAAAREDIAALVAQEDAVLQALTDPIGS
ncbi:hypothetical protein [Croceicoccus marinus]|jgi:hypothetical protein|uniref:DUF4398 domain-containing protein n=1 Tax=Croceicoccus marinus TaxID=450378 RepID=A0A7G6VX29_9SPHN|nr:hypothetical protein [Croceicoccus marinus]QNE06294.1 hypothetical protein H4O24_06735 [Croceicoccus marinus]